MSEKTQLEKVSQANARNLLQKLKEGKPLTEKQLAFLTGQIKSDSKEEKKKIPLLDRKLDREEIEELTTITLRQLQSLKKSGELTDKGDGVYQLLHVQEYIKRLRKLTENRRPEPKASDLDRNQMAARKDAAHAEKLEMENDIRRGELVEAEDVRRAWVQIGSNIRAALMSLPSRLAKELSAMDEPREIQIKIDEEVRAALISLKDD
jgi:phage terminase Nu1 subunit (DNA packaging protein)